MSDIDYFEFYKDWVKWDVTAMQGFYDFKQAKSRQELMVKIRQSGRNAVSLAKEIIQNGSDIGGIMTVYSKPRSLIKHDNLGWIFLYREKRQRKDRYSPARRFIEYYAMYSANKKGRTDETHGILWTPR